LNPAYKEPHREHKGSSHIIWQNISFFNPKMLDKFYENTKIFTVLKYAAFGIGLYGIGFR